MKAETTEQKYNRLRKYIQNLVLNGYPNPERVGCPGSYIVGDYAKRVTDFDREIEDEDDYKHIMRCSPCYAEFLAARKQCRTEKYGNAPKGKMPRKVATELSDTLDKLQRVIKSVSGVN